MLHPIDLLHNRLENTSDTIATCILTERVMRGHMQKDSVMNIAMPSHLFRIMTYNIHSCFGTDGKASPERIATVIAGVDPDIIALQEVDRGLARSGYSDQVQEIAAILGMNFIFFPSLQQKEGNYGNAILSRTPLHLVKGGALPNLPGLRRFEKRGALWVEACLPGGTLQVIATHFGLVSKERLLQTRTLLGKEWLGHPDCRPPAIICGDFNTTPRSLAYRLLADRFDDVQRAIAKQRPHASWPARHPLIRIDHLFVTPGITVAKARVVRNDLTLAASDHLPLVADLSIPELTEMRK